MCSIANLHFVRALWTVAHRSVATALIALAIFALAIFVAPASAQEQKPENPQDRPPESQQSPANPDPAFGGRMLSRPPPVVNRPANMSRPPVMNRPTVQNRVNTEGGRLTIERGRSGRPIATGAEKTIRAAKPSPERSSVTTEQRNTKPVANEQNKKPVTTQDKPITTESKPVITQSKPVTTESKPASTNVRERQGSGFAGKPDNVVHNPLRTGGELGESRNHEPVVIEKYGNHFTRSYYSLLNKGVTTWYWYDNPLKEEDVDIRTLVNIPVCKGDTEICASVNVSIDTGNCELQWVGSSSSNTVECAMTGKSGACSAAGAKCWLYDDSGKIDQPANLNRSMHPYCAC
jgi:hypothetical protein